MNDKIKCPGCGLEFEITTAFSKDIEDKIRLEFSSRHAKDMRDIKDSLVKEMSSKHQLEMLELNRKNDELQSSVARQEKFRQELEQEKADVARREKEVDRVIDNAVRQRTDEERLKIEQQVRQNEAMKFDATLKEMQNEIAKKNFQIEDFSKKEIDLRKRQLELEDKHRTLEIENTRRLDEERKKIRDEAVAKAGEDYQLIIADNNFKIESLNKQIAELHRRAEVGSQQAQGEIQELELERMLKEKFPFDIIEPVPKGFTGADLIQTVYNRNGINCGTIIWESKRTKSWSSDWISKLKTDRSTAKADVAIIVTSTLPKDVRHIGLVEDVYVCDFQSAIGVAIPLRNFLMDIQFIKSANTGRNDKIELLYNFLTSREFHSKMELMVATFVTMKEELADEQRKIAVLWKKREKQIEIIQNSTTSLYGDLKGLMGKSLEPVQALELSSPDDEILPQE